MPRAPEPPVDEPFTAEMQAGVVPHQAGLAARSRCRRWSVRQLHPGRSHLHRPQQTVRRARSRRASMRSCRACRRRKPVSKPATSSRPSTGWTIEGLDDVARIVGASSGRTLAVEVSRDGKTAAVLHHPGHEGAPGRSGRHRAHGRYRYPPSDPAGRRRGHLRHARRQGRIPGSEISSTPSTASPSIASTISSTRSVRPPASCCRSRWSAAA